MVAFFIFPLHCKAAITESDVLFSADFLRVSQSVFQGRVGAGEINGF